ncbi:MAG TPA: nitrilase family protein [Chitinophagaceae bacterium]|nr:nitrilase family protein [Chitinophagaceae bacterium]
MDNIKIATAQFEHKSGDKDYNLSVIDALSRQASREGAHIAAFHECSATGYAFARHLTKDQLLNLAETIPGGESVNRLTEIARKNDIVILAGLFEKDSQDNLYKAYVCVDKDGVVSNFRKLHPFINPHITPGDRYCVFELFGWKCGILICYDNNIIENVRATNLLGADIIFMPHVTMCTPSSRPGAGFVDPELWENRETDPTSLRLEFDGAKGREWLMKWLPARSHDNAIYSIFSNAIGMDDDQLKNGCSMIVDPFGDIIAECRKLGNDIQCAVITADKLTNAGGYRYKRARRPDLYGKTIAMENTPIQKVAWLSYEE